MSAIPDSHQLETASLLLRLSSQEELAGISALHASPEVDRYNTLGVIKDQDVIRQMVADWEAEHLKEQPRSFVFSLMTKEDQAFAGLICIFLGPARYRSAEVWYKLLPEAWGKGYATEALKAIISFGFEDLKLHRIEAGCAVANVASYRVLEKAGMIREGQKRQALPLLSGWSDNYEYAILETDSGLG